MKALFRILLLVCAILFLAGCSQSPRVTLDTEYTSPNADPLFPKVIYVFRDDGVSVYDVVGNGQDICIRKSDQTIVTSQGNANLRGVGAKKGSTLSGSANDTDPLVVLFGPGDRMPLLDSAPYKVEGTSVLVDRSQSRTHSKYFDFFGFGSGSEVFTIKNNGMILESASTPGFILTIGGPAPSKLQEQLQAESEFQQQQFREAQQKIKDAKRQIGQ